MVSFSHKSLVVDNSVGGVNALDLPSFDYERNLNVATNNMADLRRQ